MVNVQPTAAAPAVVKEVDMSVLTPYSPLAGKRKGSDTMYQKAHHDPLIEQGDMEDVQPTAVAQMQHRKWTSALLGTYPATRGTSQRTQGHLSF